MQKRFEGMMMADIVDWIDAALRLLDKNSLYKVSGMVEIEQLNRAFHGGEENDAKPTDTRAS